MRKQRLRGIDAKKMKSCLENAAPGRNESWHFLQRELKEDNDVAKLKFGRSTYYKMLDSGVVQQKNLDEFVRYLNYLDKKEKRDYTDEDFIDKEKDQLLSLEYEETEAINETLKKENKALKDCLPDLILSDNPRGKSLLAMIKNRTGRYTEDICLQDGSILYSDEGDGEYQVFLRLPYDTFRELGLKPNCSFQFDISVSVSRENSKKWEEAMREEIYNAFCEEILSLLSREDKTDESVYDIWENWFAEKILTEWELEEVQFSEDEDSVCKEMLRKYQLLMHFMEQDGIKDQFQRVIADSEFAEEMFSKYEISRILNMIEMK